MGFWHLSLALFLLSGALSWVFGKNALWANRLGGWGAVLSGVAGLVPVVGVLKGAPPLVSDKPWCIPGGSWSTGMDMLSAFFLAPVLFLGVCCALDGLSENGHPPVGRPNRGWVHYNVLLASMGVVLTARNILLFLASWEAMTLSSYFLVVSDDHQENVRRAGFTYLVASHLGMALLLFLFLQAGAGPPAGFEALRVTAPGVPILLLFLLAVAGFGLKAGWVPVHIWLPEAHPAAPAFVSALMSGAMVNVGVYGLLRVLSFLPFPLFSGGCVLAALGAASAVYGMLSALGQGDLKRFLAYSTVENMGLVALGLGMGFLGVSQGIPMLAAAGFGGAFLHIWNHSMFKALLFMLAGSVKHAAGTADMERLGGLWRHMPVTAALFFVGAAAIVGVPPMNGFLSEFLLCRAALEGSVAGGRGVAWVGLGALAVLGLVGGLVLAGFAKAFGTVFLGSEREASGRNPKDPPFLSRLATVLLAASCLTLALRTPLTPLEGMIRPWAGDATGGSTAEVSNLLGGLSAFSALAVLVLITAVLCRRVVFKGRPVSRAATWSCGYAQKVPRGQYTASSFVQPFTELFRPLLRSHRTVKPPEGFFPPEASFSERFPDILRGSFYRPAFAGFREWSGRLKRIQHGKVQLYVLYIAVTLLALILMEWW